MKFKKHILKLSILAGVLVCVIVAGSLFASGTTPADSAGNLNLMVTTSSGPVEQNQEFVVNVKISNENVTQFKIAGLEVALSYDSSKIAATNVQHAPLEKYSTVKHKIADNKVRFVCIKNEFTTEEGYTGTDLSNLFTVTFKAEEYIANPALLFDKNNIEFLIGNTEALAVTGQFATYAGDMEAIAKAILDKDLDLVADSNVGSMIVVAPTPKADETNAGYGVINDNPVEYRTGSTITVGEESAKIVVKGDLSGDGLVSVFDAAMIKKGTEDKLRNSAGELIQGDKTANAQQAIDYIIGDTDDILVPKTTN